MAHGEDPPQTPRSRSVPEVVAPTNRVNVAFPFSKIVVQENKDFDELAAVVAELAEMIEQLAPGEAIEVLRRRAQALADRPT